MYRCVLCKKVVPANTACKRIIKSRMYQHPYRSRCQKRIGVDKNGKKKIEWRDDPGGIGPQITRELQVCADCGE